MTDLLINIVVHSIQLNTMLSNDIERIVDFIRVIHQLTLSPLAIIGILGLLFYVRT